MKVLLLSEVKSGHGPGYVNAKLVEHWPEVQGITVVEHTSKLGKTMDSLLKGVSADVILSAAGDWMEMTACSVLRRFGKPIVCFNHGYVPYENIINNLGLSNRKISAYKRYLSSAKAIIANSEYQMRTVEQAQPELKGILTYVNNAIEPFSRGNTLPGRPGLIRVAASGGTRPIKGNDVVAKAVSLLRKDGIDCSLDLFGHTYAENERLKVFVDRGEVHLRGQLPTEEFLNDLGNVDVFVMNSRHEPFGLSALEAIRGGCSLLLSRNCGVAGVLDAREEDLIDDCEDEFEVARKIAWLYKHPNGERLYESIDFDSLNWDVAAQHVYESCLAAMRV